MLEMSAVQVGKHTLENPSALLFVPATSTTHSVRPCKSAMSGVDNWDCFTRTKVTISGIDVDTNMLKYSYI